MLTPRQRILYTFKASLYKPVILSPLATGDLEATNPGVRYDAPAFTNVPCFYNSTPELDVPTLAGRGKELNLFTLDEWHFTADQPIADQWVIKMTGSDPTRPAHPYVGRVWVVRDNPQTVATQGRRTPNFSMVYAVLSHIPGLSEPVAGIA